MPVQDQPNGSGAPHSRLNHDSGLEGRAETAAASVKKPEQMPVWRVVSPVAIGLGLVVAVAVTIAYGFGDGVIYINDRTISDLTLFEVTGGAAVGILGLIGGLGAAAVGAVAALVAAIVGVCVGFFGVVLGAIVVVGVVTGPALLLGIVAVLIKRRYWPDVI